MADTEQKEGEETLEEARHLLQAYLSNRRSLIRGMRAIDQYLSAGNREALSESRKIFNSELSKFGENEPFHGLCEITDDSTTFLHSSVDFDPSTTARGFYFEQVYGLQDRILIIGCVEFDSETSGSFYTNKSPEERREFLRRILRRPSIIARGLKVKPPIGVAVIQNHDGKYSIGEIVLALSS